MTLKIKKESILFILTGILCFSICLGIMHKPEVLALSDTSGFFPIIMYHHITNDNSKIGEYTISVKQLKEDFEFLKNKGYTTLSVRDLISIDKGEMELNEKSIMITFDDGQESFYKYAYPLLVEYNFKAVFSVIGKYTEDYSKINDHNVSYSHVTFNELKEMVSSGLVEIGNHSYDMHKNGKNDRQGVTKKAGESLLEYENALKKDTEKYNNIFLENLDFTPQIFTYPFGKVSKESEEIIKKLGFAAAFTCYERKTVPKASDNWLYNLGRYNRSGKYSVNEFFKKVL